jgi:hypothetical protein
LNALGSITRREFISLLDGAAVWPDTGHAQIWKLQVKKPSTRSTRRWVTVT